MTARRPVTKTDITISADGDNTQTDTIIYAWTGPGTMTGLRWDFSVAELVGITGSNMYWALVLVPEGSIVGTLNLGDHTAFYAPEENVLAYGNCAPIYTEMTCHQEGVIGTRRLVKKDWSLVFVCRGTNANGNRWAGNIQFFTRF